MSIYSTASLTMLGGREEQQDAYCLERRRGELLAAVCDGIGGLPDGAQASRSAVQALLTAFHKNPQAAPSYKTYGWQATTGSEEARQQAQFVSRFFDIYENSFK